MEAGSVASDLARTSPLGSTRHRSDRLGDRGLLVVAGLATGLAMLVIALIIWKVFQGSWLAIRHFGIGFVWASTWNPVTDVYGARQYIIGTIVASFGAMLIAAPLAIAIGLFLTELAPQTIRAIVGPLVEMLAAVPSIVYGFWGLVVLVPFINGLEPGLHSALGFLPIFGPASPVGISVFTAGLVLTVMILPIISALSRDLFLTVPADLKDGAEALGATRWEVIRGIVLPSTASGVGAAVMLGLGRALGEAIAVSFVIGDVTQIHASLFDPGSSIAAQIANDFLGAVNPLETASLFYIGFILVVIAMLTSIAARGIAGRFDVSAGMLAKP